MWNNQNLNRNLKKKMNFKELKMVKLILMTVITMEEVIVMQGAPRTYAL